MDRAVSITKDESNKINVKVYPRKQKVETEDYNITYSDYIFDISLNKIEEKINFNELIEEDKKFINQYREDNIIKTDYIYEVSVMLNEKFKDNPILILQIDKDAINITYDYTDYGVISINGIKDKEIVTRYSEKYSERFYINYNNCAADFLNSDGDTKEKLTIYIDIYNKTSE